MNGRRDGYQCDVECFGIRFEPSGIAALLVACGIAPVETPPPSVEQSLAPKEQGISHVEIQPVRARSLSEKHVQEWLKLFLEAYPNPTEALARASIDGMFPGHNTPSRQRLRELLPSRKVGKPPKSID